ncbi:hypothetical protein COW09_01475 [bacterium (Candidatus Moisslbacteria) CG12_big_fil_rev_8_21_14_0_65_36_11]|nr:hypothetical protein [Candidatus Kuenenbacteria bacterium]OIP76334.1 MAG: hypothetical protein AUK09_02280 [Parcubacteria group bacterium CG2_30_36_38]PIV46205.1 MAG: hypothetical protein COS23_00360 [bacterium (Candidatus Moisslbacteria) CG02_land_8_20_14_3_00_36_53]PIW67829.1 MAG: hypothetical protein COW09_01475 [bacterium (Candidatus Moisslbacteria) CG12_big_fil_rev_8_21_14_0_65_36_11]PIZ90481.1 MAG: hypothetical protein COX87_00425 [bacterium (Candidatus Moisslbacteria) CG_4_10_14_0_2_u
MAIKLKRRENEPISLFLKRFSEKVKRSNLVTRYKESLFRRRAKGKRVIKKEALERKKFGKRLEYLRKIGKIREKQPYDQKNRR